MMIIKKKFIKLLLLVLPVFIFACAWRYLGACGSARNNANVLVVGVMSGFEPYARINQEGGFEGFDIDVAREIARQLKKDLVLKDMTVAALAIALQQGKIDLLLSAYSITKDTKKVMSLIYYQGGAVTSFPLVFWKEIPQGITSINDLANIPNVTVCSEAGTKKVQFLEQFDFLSIKTMPNIKDLVMDIKYGKSIAMFIDPEILPVLKKQNPDLVSLDIPVPEEYQSEGFGIGVKKNNTELTNQVSLIIAKLRGNGMLDRLESKWFEGE